MNKQNIKKYYFEYLLALYALTVLVVIFVLMLNTIKGSAIAGKSQIPTLESQRLEKTHAILNQREALNYPEKTDLSDYEFGKAEPFQ